MGNPWKKTSKEILQEHWKCSSFLWLKSVSIIYIFVSYSFFKWFLLTSPGQSRWKLFCGCGKGQRGCPTLIPSRSVDNITLFFPTYPINFWRAIAGEAKMGTDESAFNSILVTRSWAQIRQIMVEYQSMHGKSLEKVVESEFSANAEKGLLAICNWIYGKSCTVWNKRIYRWSLSCCQCAVLRIGPVISPNVCTRQLAVRVPEIVAWSASSWLTAIPTWATSKENTRSLPDGAWQLTFRYYWKWIDTFWCCVEIRLIR